MVTKKEFRDYVRQLLRSMGDGDELFIKNQLNVITRLAKQAYTGEDNEAKIPQEDIDAVYAAYPTKCVVNGRSLGKSHAHKLKIEKRLREKSVDYMIGTIERYTESCKSEKTYMKNFSTFLNNLPEYDLTEKVKPVISEVKDLRNITEAQ